MTEKRRKPWSNSRATNPEFGALLRLFTSLGFTLAASIFGFFMLGVFVERKAAEMGLNMRMIPRVAFMLFGVALGIYWAYLRIARHLDQYEGEKDPGKNEDFPD